MNRKISILDKIKQKGIVNQSRQFIASGMVINTFTNILTLGRSKTALELIQMNKMLKVKNKLRRKYSSELKKDLEVRSGVVNNTIWIMWLQGLENAPCLVKKAVKSIKQSLPEQRVVILDASNFQDYVDVPHSIIDKWKLGVISNPHFSDIVRMELLIQKGGTWFDSTIMLDRNFDTLQNILESNQTFFFQNMRPGQMGNSIWLSTWLIHSCSNESTLIRVREILYDYWQNHNYLMDYFLFHIIWHLVYEFHDVEYNKIKKISNSTPLQLMYLLNEKNNETLTEEILHDFPLQKLTYKNISDDKGTTYWYLMKR
ncbi:capsular polysaccharide synthesis protein [Leuconostoc suionicum]|uniref:capsular polysaccharide synthesis protein n=1 Tax=Leuconostoc suionicum TaxID=1511761 RepID=UPI00233F61D6|nr:capsular polysaccharide synthesis protein [Leuconostoc suionicum]MDC2816365.1 capsular polysaccharide synthesis protein [Leuconostoc suionicum]